MSPFAQQVAAEAAREEVGRVLLARDSLAHYAEYMSDGWYTAHKMHHIMARELEQVLRFLETDGKEGTQFLIILTAPQHGKSTLTSQFFPSFALGKLPNLRVSLVCYGESLAAKHSRAARNMVASKRYSALFGSLSPSDVSETVNLSNDSKSVTAWDLAEPNRGGMIAAGVGGAVSGNPKGLFVLDDMIKDHREAAKKDVRDDVWDFYLSSIRVRMMAGVLVMTHWHPDDPAGRLFKQMVSGDPDADQWKVLDLPGLMEPGLFAKDVEEQRKRMADGVFMGLADPLGRKDGEVLCPPMLSKGEMLKIRAGNKYFFTALYQQRPYAKEGQRYKKEWFKIIKAIPDGVTLEHIVCYWDKAGTVDGDFTAGVLEGSGSDENFYFLDVVHGRWTTNEREKEMRKAAKKHTTRWGTMVKIWHQQDPGSAGLDSAKATNRGLSGYKAKFETVTGSKETRSENLESSAQGGQVYLLEAPWNEAFVDELVAFPKGNYDDRVDAASSAHNKLLEMVGESRESKIL
jgi:predicted phage terminase large subunit-like protein